MGKQSSTEDDANPFQVTVVRELPPAESRRRTGPVAMFFAFLFASFLAAGAFASSFFITCLGIGSIRGGEPMAFVIVGLITISTFVFAFWCFIRIVRAFRSV